MLAVGAHELDLLFLLAHTLDLMPHFLDHNYLLWPWLCLTQDVLSWQLNPSLSEGCQVWRYFL